MSPTKWIIHFSALVTSVDDNDESVTLEVCRSCVVRFTFKQSRREQQGMATKMDNKHNFE